VDSAGGKIIANGFCGLNRRILFRGLPVNSNSFEWGHFDILPNSDSAYFANVRFVNFNKRNSVDVTNFYSLNDNQHAIFNAAINNVINGVGGVICSFSANTFIYDAIVDSCTASFAGGAFAFLQAPAAWPGPGLRGGPAVDDGRLALANHQVTRLTIRDTKVINAETSGLTNDNALGGAIYMASNSSSLLTSDFVTCYLGYSAYTTGGSVAIPGTSGCVSGFSSAQDQMLFERCAADNTFGNAADFAKGGAIFVGSNTALVLAQCTFNNDSAIESLTGSNAGLPDANSWGGAIAVSPTSGNPNATNSGTTNATLPGLKIYKTATFAGNVAGKGGAIALDFNIDLASFTTAAPRLNIDAENVLTSVPGVKGVVRDSGLIQFNGNIAYTYGGAIYSPNMVFIKGYLAPQNFPWQGGSQAVELRVKFFNNVAGEGGGSTYPTLPPAVCRTFTSVAPGICRTQQIPTTLA
jgi:predicted outer membrane repeat protein